MEFDESLIVERTDDLGVVTGAEPDHLMTLHCLKCNTVLADSLGVCGELKCIDSIMCTRVTSDVLVRDPLESTHTGEMANCFSCKHLRPSQKSWTYTEKDLHPGGAILTIYLTPEGPWWFCVGGKGVEYSICSHLKCRSCNCVVGKVIHAAPSHLAAVRSLFLLDKTKMSCYILDSCSMVAASSLSFDLKPIQETVHEARQEFEEQLDLMAHTCSRLADISMSVSSRSTN